MLQLGVRPCTGARSLPQLRSRKTATQCSSAVPSTGAAAPRRARALLISRKARVVVWAAEGDMPEARLAAASHFAL